MVHQYKLGGHDIVIDVCSGAIHETDDVTYELIAQFPDREREELVSELAKAYDLPVDEVEEIYDDVLALKEDGQLFTEDTFEPMAGELKARTSGVVKAL